MTRDDRPTGNSSEEERILDHLRSHPAAIDTIRGVSEWWVPDSDPREIAAALERLESLGLVLRCSRPDGSALFAAGPNLGSNKNEPE
ncbi:hypothetical protein [Erythrobacter ani]|uniref:MarR family transcriptional regulator n=1 Tax=Erythrobacter ani TaxID=2827235 RepID=A0ABS6SMI5_9SPHN|nr:hypothetical protein [Erythrobacter ani]MBV7266253.1 hypothetical protein [Erythrobacter ani]